MLLPNIFQSVGNPMLTRPYASSTASLLLVLYIHLYIYINIILTSFSSPEDQKILEEAFHNDPRPGKAARKDIVSRVSLADKEVQIWFQNRRQNTRRKMRLEGHDVASSSEGSDPILPSSSPEPPTMAEQDRNTVSNLKAKTMDANATIITAAEPTSSAPQPSNLPFPKLEFPSSVPEALETQPTEISNSQGSQGSQIQISSQQSNKSGYIANRRVTTSFLEDIDFAPAPAPRKTIRRFASSHDFRLSMTDDGTAKVVDRSQKSPSPERPRSTAVENAIVSRLGSLRRSYSAAGLDTSSPTSSSHDAARKLPRTSALGRSRDSRTWEFWCDSDARSSLISRAEQETSGSAAEAIGLIRSNSSRVLRLNTQKMNSPNPGHHRSRDGKRPGLQRSQTHHGFVKTKPTQTFQSKNQSNKKANDDEFEQLNTESDKENNEPSTTRSSRPSQPTFMRGTKVLGENMEVMSHSSSLGSMMAREGRSKSSRGPKPVGIHVDEEVASFMGSSDSGTAIGEDLDCVQSLLSLSQGNWA
jgi:hypothetical protein